MQRHALFSSGASASAVGLLRRALLLRLRRLLSRELSCLRRERLAGYIARAPRARGLPRLHSLRPAAPALLLMLLLLLLRLRLSL
jgi:hypothetical protein